MCCSRVRLCFVCSPPRHKINKGGPLEDAGDKKIKIGEDGPLEDEGDKKIKIGNGILQMGIFSATYLVTTKLE